MPLGIFEPGMVFLIQRSVLNGITDISVQDRGAVQYYLDMITYGGDLFLIPFSQRLQIAAFGRNDAIHGSVVLIFMQVPVDLGFVIQYLDLHAYIGGISFQRGAYADPVIGSRG